VNIPGVNKNTGGSGKITQLCFYSAHLTYFGLENFPTQTHGAIQTEIRPSVITK